ncbi:MAG: IgGFc-binding protein, partial [Acidobacteria bacterium]|nr:IgGFc-binding protein [Acidobacteriota bacterium]
MRTAPISAVLLSLVVLTFAAAPMAAAADSSGTDFWVAFPRNIPPEETNYLLINAEAPTSGVISNASLAINVPFNVVPGTTTKVTLPLTLEISSNDLVESKGVHVTSLAPITIHGSCYRTFSSDAYLALPVDAIGTDYVLMSWGPGVGYGSELTVVATQNATTVTITPTVSAGVRNAGVPFQLVMQQGQSYLLAPAGGDGDLTGSTIVADKPISVFGGNSAGQVPTTEVDFAEHMVEQMFPVNAWGQTFTAMPLAMRSGSFFRVLASQNGTEVTYNGALAANLNAGQFSTFLST